MENSNHIMKSQDVPTGVAQQPAVYYYDADKADNVQPVLNQQYVNYNPVVVPPEGNQAIYQHPAQNPVNYQDGFASNMNNQNVNPYPMVVDSSVNRNIQREKQWKKST
eukprot:CAMPEP_0168330282 /NCGR_PEP_ID=MMETSP0213-20121227/7629_1 /TAXON_ID=151035 /ORGANISM="Euplotes harpa, Strain FSP1.4" /LENGTH=107 /DNA_ID=CAMNT_0008333805 /DNA_START=1 /DNA_END=324 /DNA_ORIENTATION=+